MSYSILVELMKKTGKDTEIMWELTVRGIDFYHLINWFFAYSFLGWLWETCYVSAKQGTLINRGFINGPLCTIYGCGALSVYLILVPVQSNTVILFFGGIVVATVLEYITAWLMESIFHTSWWDYSDKKFNLHGRICLGASLGWGFFTVMLFRVLQPGVEYVTGLYPRRVGEIGICAITCVYVVDFCFSAAAAFHLHERIPFWEQSLEEMQAELIVKARKRMSELEANRGFALDEVKERIEDLNLVRELEEKRASMMQEVSAELQKRKEAMASKFGHNMQRFVHAYPNLNRGYRIHLKKREEKKNQKH